MNIKIINSNFMNEDWMTHFQFIAKKQFAFQKNYDDKSSQKKKYNTIFLRENLRTNIENWLGKLNEDELMKVFTFESKFFSSILIQMINSIKVNYQKFQLKNEEAEIINKIKEATLMPFAFKENEEKEKLFHLNSFFNLRSFMMNDFDKSCSTSDFFEKYLKMINLQNLKETMCLTRMNSSCFLFYMKSFTQDQCFTNICKVTYDCNLKAYYWNYPDWFQKENHYNVYEFASAYIERTIFVKYLIFQNNEKIGKLDKKFVFSFYDEHILSNFFEKRSNIIDFLEKEYSSNKQKLLEDINYNNVEKMPKKRSLNLMNFNSDNKQEISDEVRQLYFRLSFDEFVDLLLYQNLKSSSNQYNNIFDAIYKLFSDKNFQEIFENNDKLKNKKTRKTECDKNNTQSHFLKKFSFIPRKNENVEENIFESMNITQITNKNDKKYAFEFLNLNNISQEKYRLCQDIISNIIEKSLSNINSETKNISKTQIEEIKVNNELEFKVKKSKKSPDSESDTEYSSSNETDNLLRKIKSWTSFTKNYRFKRRNLRKKHSAIFKFTLQKFNFDNLDSNQELIKQTLESSFNSKNGSQCEKLEKIDDDSMFLEKQTKKKKHRQKFNKNKKIKIINNIVVNSSDKNIQIKINNNNIAINSNPIIKEEKIREIDEKSFKIKNKNEELKQISNNSFSQTKGFLFSNPETDTKYFNSSFIKPKIPSYNKFNTSFSQEETPNRNPKILINNNIEKENIIYYNNPSFEKKNLGNISNDLNMLNTSNFFMKLNYDILTFSNSVDLINYSLREIKLFCISFLKIHLECILNQEQFNLIIYGSFATDLLIESSDIDLNIKLQSNKFNYIELIYNISQSLSELNVFDTVHPILTASVPILKLKIDPMKILPQHLKEMYIKFKKSDLFTKYLFGSEDLTKIKIDLNFTDHEGSIQAVEWAQQQLFFFPEIRPLIKVLKRILNSNKLNSSFDGGISSHSLLILLVSFLKISKTRCLGRLLYDFLYFYGKCYDLNKALINVNSNFPFDYNPRIQEILPFIYDPIKGHNVVKNSFRINEVRLNFSYYFDILNNYKIFLDGEMAKRRNLIYDLLLNISI